MKTVRIVNIRPAGEVTVQIGPEESAAMVLQKAGLNPNEYSLINPTTQMPFQATEMPYEHVSDHGKLHTLPQSNVGR